MRKAASGFFYAFPRSGKRGNESDGFWPWLVTCKHVVQDIGRDYRPDRMILRINQKNSLDTHMFALPIRETEDLPNWNFHPTMDVAVIPIDWDSLNERGVQWRVFASGRNAISKNMAIMFRLREGDAVFILGFPVGWKPGRRDYPIVRHGVLAQVRGWFNGDHETFLVDGSGFVGNSGGPVIAGIQDDDISESERTSRSGIIGMVSELKLSSIYSKEVNLNESADLIEVVPVDAIDETIELAMEQGVDFIGWP